MVFELKVNMFCSEYERVPFELRALVIRGETPEDMVPTWKSVADALAAALAGDFMHEVVRDGGVTYIHVWDPEGAANDIVVVMTNDSTDYYICR